MFIENSKIVPQINDEISVQLLPALGFTMESFMAFDLYNHLYIYNHLSVHIRRVISRIHLM